MSKALFITIVVAGITVLTVTCFFIAKVSTGRTTITLKISFFWLLSS